MSRLAVTVLAVLVAAAGVVGLVAFLQGRDTADIGTAPGRTDTSARAAHVPAGDVLLVGADSAALRRVAEPYVAPAPPTVRVQRDSALGAGVHAFALRRRLDVASPDDPALQAFIEYWLGR